MLENASLPLQAQVQTGSNKFSTILLVKIERKQRCKTNAPNKTQNFHFKMNFMTILLNCIKKRRTDEQKRAK